VINTPIAPHFLQNITTQLLSNQAYRTHTSCDSFLYLTLKAAFKVSDFWAPDKAKVDTTFSSTILWCSGLWHCEVPLLPTQSLIFKCTSAYLLATMYVYKYSFFHFFFLRINTNTIRLAYHSTETLFFLHSKGTKLTVSFTTISLYKQQKFKAVTCKCFITTNSLKKHTASTQLMPSSN
jgi:hypothetical protein